MDPVSDYYLAPRGCHRRNIRCPLHPPGGREVNVIGIVNEEASRTPEPLWLSLVMTFPPALLRFMVCGPAHRLHEVISKDAHRTQDKTKKFSASYANQLAALFTQAGWQVSRTGFNAGFSLSGTVFVFAGAETTGDPGLEAARRAFANAGLGATPGSNGGTAYAPGILVGSND